MANWIKWWKDKTFLKIWGVILLSMGASLGIILINPDNIWCIIGSIGAAMSGGLIIRKIITNRLNKLADKLENK